MVFASTKVLNIDLTESQLSANKSWVRRVNGYSKSWKMEIKKSRRCCCCCRERVVKMSTAWFIHESDNQELSLPLSMALFRIFSLARSGFFLEKKPNGRSIIIHFSLLIVLKRFFVVKIIYKTSNCQKNSLLAHFIK